MTVRESTSVQPTSVSTSKVGMSCRFNDIDTIGFWVNNKTGEGYRITGESLKPGHSPVIDFVSLSDQFTLVSTDPYAPISKLRQNTADLDLPVGF